MRLALALQDFSCAVSGLFFYEPTYAHIYIYIHVCVCVCVDVVVHENPSSKAL